jgi:4-hydroxy-tetrahydrodipicolinate synthase
MFRGTYTAMITPFLEDGSVDMEGFRRNLRRQAAGGVAGVLVCGTTGEPPTLSEKEQEELVAAAVSELKGKATVIAGTGTYSTAESVRKTRRAEELGADAVLVVTPYYSRPSDEGIFLHYKSISEATALPVIAYNIAGRTGKNIESELMARLAALPNVMADKEASGSAAQCSAIIEKCLFKKDFAVLSGDDGMTLPFMALGATGVISVIANAVPARVVAFVNAVLAGDWAKARESHYSFIMPLTRLAFLDSNPIPIKHICARLGIAAGGYRLPLCEMDAKKKEAIDVGLRDLGLFASV